MNPHFLFNSLNSVNQFIASNNELEANKFLSSYAGLMRRIMENSNKDFILLSDELELIAKYLQLEKLRFGDKFDYDILVSGEIDPDSVNVPNMLVQPNLENAIWHGLRYRDSKGLLKIRFGRQGRKMFVTIEDNGIGYSRSRELKTANQKEHESRGLGNVQERIRLLNEIHSMRIVMEMHEKENPESGVVVKISW
jgi:LytS/YehU family sensor histidine kinase